MTSSSSSSDSFRLKCPQCEKSIHVPKSMLGKTGKCPGCGGQIAIITPTAKTADKLPPPVSPPPPPGYSDPLEVQSFASKKVAAGVCGILLGAFGVHKFILGLTNAGVIMLVVSLVGLVTAPCIIVPIFACMAMSIIGVVEGIVYLTKTDQDFYETYAVRKKEWF